MTVTVKGEPDPETGFVMNFKVLNQIIKKEILEKVDHRNINLDVDFMKGKMPTCENLAIEFWKILEPAIQRESPKVRLHSIKLYETINNYAEYLGE